MIINWTYGAIDTPVGQMQPVWTWIGAPIAEESGCFAAGQTHTWEFRSGQATLHSQFAAGSVVQHSRFAAGQSTQHSKFSAGQEHHGGFQAGEENC